MHLLGRTGFGPPATCRSFALIPTIGLLRAFLLCDSPACNNRKLLPACKLTRTSEVMGLMEKRRRLSQEHRNEFIVAFFGGEGGIRTLDTGFGPYSGLAILFPTWCHAIPITYSRTRIRRPTLCDLIRQLWDTIRDSNCGARCPGTLGIPRTRDVACCVQAAVC